MAKKWQLWSSSFFFYGGGDGNITTDGSGVENNDNNTCESVDAGEGWMGSTGDCENAGVFSCGSYV